MGKSFIRLPTHMCWILLAACGYVTSASAEARVMEWEEPVDRDAQTFEDPYRALEPQQLVKLIAVARLRQRAG